MLFLPNGRHMSLRATPHQLGGEGGGKERFIIDSERDCQVL